MKALLALWLVLAGAAGSLDERVAVLYGEAQAEPDAVLIELAASPELDPAWRTVIEAKALHYLTRFDDSLALLQPLLETLNRETTPALFVATQRFVGQNHYRMGAMDQALRAALAAVDGAVAFGIDDELGHVRNLLGAAYLRTGQMDLALAQLEAALAQFRALGSRGDVAKLENNLAVLYIEQGDLAAAEPHLLASIALARELDRQSTLVSNLVNLVELRAAQDRFEEAARALEECFQVTALGSSSGSRVFCHESATALYDRNGALASAIDNTRDALALAMRLGLSQVALDNTVALAELLARAGDHEAAYGYSETARTDTLALKDRAIEARLRDLEALQVAERDRLAVARLEERSAFQRRNQQVLVLGIAVLAPLLLGALWLLRVRGRLLRALERERDRSDRLARTDPLTGLANRRDFRERLATIHRGGSAYGVIMIDIDHFKRINDTLGHAAGDEVLVAVASCLAALAPKGAMIGRWGGEEYIVLLAAGTGAEAVAERFRRAVAELDSEKPITISLGVAERSPSDSDPEPVLRRADQALYASKRAGRDRVSVAGR